MSSENGLQSEHLFSLGRTVMSKGIYQKMIMDRAFIGGVLTALTRHSMGDWGDLCDNDKEMNDRALKAELEGRHTDILMSTYTICGHKVNILTEEDRSVTTVYFPEEN